MNKYLKVLASVALLGLSSASSFATDKEPATREPAAKEPKEGSDRVNSSNKEMDKALRENDKTMDRDNGASRPASSDNSAPASADKSRGDPNKK